MMLILFLMYFVLFLDINSKQMIVLMHMNIEQKYLNELYRFSFIESDVCHQIIKYYDDYELRDFTLNYEEGDVSIKMIDETALIHYQFEKDIYAILSYDLVFDSATDYEIVDFEIYNAIDKFED